MRRGREPARGEVLYLAFALERFCRRSGRYRMRMRMVARLADDFRRAGPGGCGKVELRGAEQQQRIDRLSSCSCSCSGAAVAVPPP